MGKKGDLFEIPNNLPEKWWGFFDDPNIQVTVDTVIHFQRGDAQVVASEAKGPPVLGRRPVLLLQYVGKTGTKAGLNEALAEEIASLLTRLGAIKRLPPKF